MECLENHLHLMIWDANSWELLSLIIHNLSNHWKIDSDSNSKVIILFSIIFLLTWMFWYDPPSESLHLWKLFNSKSQNVQLFKDITVFTFFFHSSINIHWSKFDTGSLLHVSAIHKIQLYFRVQTFFLQENQFSIF